MCPKWVISKKLIERFVVFFSHLDTPELSAMCISRRRNSLEQPQYAER